MHRRSEETAVTVARQRKVEIQEYAVGAQPGDTNNRPSIVRENVGHTLDTVMTRRQEPRQAMHHAE